MRVILNKNYGLMTYPTGCASRQDILVLFDSLEETDDESLINDKRVTMPIKYKNNLFYTTESSFMNFRQKLAVVDVDTSKLWKIEEYDGMESLVYYKIGDNNQLEEIEWEILNIQ